MASDSDNPDVRYGEGAEGFPHGSKYPFFMGVGLFFTGAGLSMFLPLLIVGVPLVLYGMAGWTWEYAIEEYERGVIPEQKRQLLGIKSGYLAMLLVIVGELLIFAGLFVAWFYLSAERSQFFPPNYPDPTLWVGAVMTGLLILASLSMVYARSSIGGDNRSGLNIGIVIAVLLGVVFLGLLGYEWSNMMAEGVDWTTGPYGATYYALTGVHAVHLLVGIVLAGIIGYRSMGRGHFDSERHLMVSTTEVYWHFLTLVSILILAFVYFPTQV